MMTTQVSTVKLTPTTEQICSNLTGKSAFTGITGGTQLIASLHHNKKKAPWFYRPQNK